MHAGGQEFDPPRLHHPGAQAPSSRNSPNFQLPPPSGWRQPILNNSETCSRIVIQCNNNAGSCLPRGGWQSRCVLVQRASSPFRPSGRTPGGVRSVAPARNCVTEIQPDHLSHEQAASAPNPRLAVGAAVAGRSKDALDYMVKHESASGGCLGSQRR